MVVPAFMIELDGVLNISAVTQQNGTDTWGDGGPPKMNLIAPDGSGQKLIAVPPPQNPDGSFPPGPYTINQEPVSQSGTYGEFLVKGNIASVMPCRAGGPLKGARWVNYLIQIVPTSGL